jgi:hypothetical protein
LIRIDWLEAVCSRSRQEGMGRRGRAQRMGRMWKEKKRNEGMGRSEWWRETFVWREWVDTFKMTNRHALSNFEVLNDFLKHLEIINHK